MLLTRQYCTSGMWPELLTKETLVGGIRRMHVTSEGPVIDFGDQIISPNLC